MKYIISLQTLFMSSFWTSVTGVIKKSDVLLLIIDARFMKETRNEVIEKRVRKTSKPLIFVATKTDTLSKHKKLKKQREFKNVIFVSAKKQEGRFKLRKRIMEEAEKRYGAKKSYDIGVLGYPNVGKSSLINMMKKRHSASTSALGGHTKGPQMIRVDEKLMFLDTPGIIPRRERDAVKHMSIGVINFDSVKNPDLMVMKLMEKYPRKIEQFYEVPVGEDKEKTIEKIAKKRGLIRKGGVPEVMLMSKMILKDFQRGKIKV